MEVGFSQNEMRLSEMSRQLGLHLIDITRYLQDIRKAAQFHQTCSV